jgi:hypothetical protein
MPMRVVDPMPASPVDPRFGAPLLAHDASYFAASARMDSFFAISMGHEGTLRYRQGYRINMRLLR